MKWWFKKPKKLNETTRLYALYGESANLDFLDSTIKDNTTKINENTQNIQTNKNNIQNNANKIETNKQNITNLENRVNNIQQPDLSNYTTKQYVDTQDTSIRSEINTVRNKVNSNEREITGVKASITTLSNEHNLFAKTSGNEQRWNNVNIFDNNTGFGTRINMNNNKIINLATPTDRTDAATKEYVDLKTSTNQEVISFAINVNRSIQLSGILVPTYWTQGNLRTYYNTPSNEFTVIINNPIKVGAYVITCNWIVQFPGGWKHSTTSTIYKSSLGKGDYIIIDISELGFYTAPSTIGLPERLTLHSISGIKV